MLELIRKIIRGIIRIFNFLLYCLSDPMLLRTYFEYKHIKKKNYIAEFSNINPLSQEILTHGYCKVDLLMEDINLVKQMGNRFNKLLKHKKYVMKPDPARLNTLTYGKYLFNFQGVFRLYFPEIPYIIEHGAGDILRAYFKADYEIISIEISKKKYVSHDSTIKEVFSNFWHFDWRRRETSWLLVVLHLNDHTDEEAFQTFDLSTSNEALKNNMHGRFPNNRLPVGLKDKPIIRTGGPAGSCYLANAADMLHRAGDLRPGKDRDVMFVFVGANVPWPTNDGFINETDKTIS